MLADFKESTKILDISQKQHHVIYVNTKISWREPAPDCELYFRIYVQFNWNSFMGKLMICHVVDSLVMSHIAKFLIGVLRKYISCILHYAPRFYKVHDLDIMIPRFVTEKCTIVITDDIFKWSCWKLCGSMIGICNFLCPESCCKPFPWSSRITLLAWRFEADYVIGLDIPIIHGYFVFRVVFPPP